jgi:SAM-dependent methyltransferase
MTIPSEFDQLRLPLAIKFITECRVKFINKYLNQKNIICDIGNQGKEIPELQGYKLTTLDITESTFPDLVADITSYNANIPSNFFDALLCTDVLEHVVEPFAAIKELKRIVKVGGVILITTPLNARIHGPIPDCWRFTEFGLKVMLRDFELLEFDKLNTPDRNLFPLHYSAIVRKISNSSEESDPRKMVFQRVD